MLTSDNSDLLSFLAAHEAVLDCDCLPEGTIRLIFPPGARVSADNLQTVINLFRWYAPSRAIDVHSYEGGVAVTLQPEVSGE